MFKQIAISIYLFIFTIFFKLFKLMPQKDVTAFVASFGDNILFTVKELERQNIEQKIVILETRRCHVPFYDYPNRMILKFDCFRPIQWVRSIYYIATADRIFVDNYYHFLAVSDFLPHVECVQLWHAAGAIKQFGLKDHKVENESRVARNRFRRVYERFDHVVVGSEQMSDVFQESFGLTEKQMLKTGVPRTDFFYDRDEINYVKHLMYMEFPIFKQKKVILYAPTYRDHELNVSQLHLDITKLYDELKYDYVLLLKLHPAVNGSFENKHPGFAFNMSNYPNVNHLLTISDLLITDYSSIPFEYSLLHKPIIFYAYDLDKYAKIRGLYDSYEDFVPGPVVSNTDELIDCILRNDFDLERVKTFAQEWNEFSAGRASADLVKSIYGLEDEEIVKKTNVLDTATAESIAAANPFQKSRLEDEEEL